MPPKIVHRILLTSALLGLVALVTVSVRATRVQAAPLPQTARTVQIQNFAFQPNPLTVAVGTTVTWTNRDQAPHTATTRDGSFDTERIAPGASKALTLTRAGTFEYFCEIHPRMVAQLLVQPATLPTTGATSQSSTLLTAVGVLALLVGVGINVGLRQHPRKG